MKAAAAPQQRCCRPRRPFHHCCCSVEQYWRSGTARRSTSPHSQEDNNPSQTVQRAAAKGPRRPCTPSRQQHGSTQPGREAVHPAGQCRPRRRRCGGDAPTAFVCSSPLTRTNPGLEVPAAGGCIALPLQEDQAVASKAVCSLAPFGQGEATVTDTAVRHTWQLDPSAFQLTNSRKQHGQHALRGGACWPANELWRPHA